MYYNRKNLSGHKSSVLFQFCIVLSMGNVFLKFIAKKGITSVDLLVKFKMAAKTAVKINKCDILAFVWSRALFPMAWEICSRGHYNASHVILRYFRGQRWKITHIQDGRQRLFLTNRLLTNNPIISCSMSFFWLILWCRTHLWAENYNNSRVLRSSYMITMNTIIWH